MTSGRQLAYEHLKNTVLNDSGMQGRFVNEQALADEIGVSRTPIREALLLLAAEELVQLVPKRGAYIAPVSTREIRELFEFRAVIECYSAKRAIELATVPIERMNAELDLQRGAGQDAHAFIDHDHAFHSALVLAVGNGVLSRSYDALRARQVRAGVVALYRAADRRQSVLAEHETILRALADADEAAGVEAITAHLNATQRVLLQG